MSSLNFADKDALPIDQATAWDGVDSNTNEVPWGTIITLQPHDLGGLTQIGQLKKWSGIQNPVTPISQEVARATTNLLDHSAASEGATIH